MRRRMPTRTILLTGFPGFIGTRLVARLLADEPESRIVVLVEPRMAGRAQEVAVRLEGGRRIEVVTGDIGERRLGLTPARHERLAAEVTHVVHLAAVYDLAVARDVGLRINVAGTKNILEFLPGAPAFERLDYVSTAYVSGTAVGTYRETDLDVGQKFKNYYEETKFLAEVAVKESRIPAAIYRPGIVVGNSKTGETAKFDGPYFSLNAMGVLPSPGVFIKVGTGDAEVNLVPVDFVLEAIARLSTWPGAIGKTYHLTDPGPSTAFEIEEMFAKALGKSFLYVPVPLLVATLLFTPKQVQKWFGMPVQSLDYFDHPVHYDAKQATKDLARFDVACPPFSDYVQQLVAFWRTKKDAITRGAMI